MTRGPRLAPTRVISSTLLVTTGLLATVLGLVHAQGTRTVRDGVFSDAQAARGEALYTTSCAGCHGSALNGGAAPPLVGDASLAFWRTQPVSLLADKIRHTMPPGAAGTLTPPQASDLVAHLLKAGGFPAGSTELDLVFYGLPVQGMEYALTGVMQIGFPHAILVPGTAADFVGGTITYDLVGTTDGEPLGLEFEAEFMQGTIAGCVQTELTVETG